MGAWSKIQRWYSTHVHSPSSHVLRVSPVTGVLLEDLIVIYRSFKQYSTTDLNLHGSLNRVGKTSMSKGHSQDIRHASNFTRKKS